jgi:hypothetical protein
MIVMQTRNRLGAGTADDRCEPDIEAAGSGKKHRDTISEIRDC